MDRFSYRCRSTGDACEWGVEADSTDSILARAAEHRKCAHKDPELSEELRSRIAGAIRPT